MGRDEQVVPVCLGQPLLPRPLDVAQFFAVRLTMTGLQHLLEPLQNDRHVCSRCVPGDARRND